MGQFGRAALLAANLLRQGIIQDPEKAWNKAIRTQTTSLNVSRKRYPKDAFIDLCQCGWIRGVSATKNKEESISGLYAVRMLMYLCNNKRGVAPSHKALWGISGKKNCSDSSIPDIVIHLWVNGEIKCPKKEC